VDEPFHRTRPDSQDEYERYTLVQHPEGPYVRHERIRLHAAQAENPFMRQMQMIDVGAFLAGDRCPTAKRKLQALLEAISS